MARTSSAPGAIFLRFSSTIARLGRVRFPSSVANASRISAGSLESFSSESFF